MVILELSSTLMQRVLTKRLKVHNTICKSKYKQEKGNVQQPANMRNYKILSKTTDFNRKSAVYEKKLISY